MELAAFKLSKDVEINNYIKNLNSNPNFKDVEASYNTDGTVVVSYVTNFPQSKVDSSELVDFKI